MSAIIFSLVSKFSFDSPTKTLMMKYSPLGKNTIPISFTAAVTPVSLFVPDQPVLWATIVPSGNCPFIRFLPVFVSLFAFQKKS